MLLKCDVAWRTLERGNTKFLPVNWVDEVGLKHNLKKIEKLIFRALGIRQKDPAQKREVIVLNILSTKQHTRKRFSTIKENSYAV